MAVSFSAGAKAEVCRAAFNSHCCALAQCFGILLFGNSFTSDGVRIVTENRDFAQILPKLFHKAFSMDFDVRPQDDSGKQVFVISDSEKCNRLMDAYGFDPDSSLSLHINLQVLENDCCKAAFLRGAFLAGGSVTDPGKGYHLELTTSHASVAREAYALMQEVLGFYPKQTSRTGSWVLYFKQSDQISDCLTYLSAPIAAMDIIEARLEKELSNKVNRRCNCDDANTSKVVEAAQQQLTAIRTLRSRGILDKLPKKLKEAAIAREKNPDASLTELAQLMEPPITKPAMNHRLKKLAQLAQEA